VRVLLVVGGCFCTPPQRAFQRRQQEQLEAQELAQRLALEQRRVDATALQMREYASAVRAARASGVDEGEEAAAAADPWDSASPKELDDSAGGAADPWDMMGSPNPLSAALTPLAPEPEPEPEPEREREQESVSVPPAPHSSPHADGSISSMDPWEAEDGDALSLEPLG
jgi:hypothetical protein